MIVERLKNLRKSRKVSQKDFAQAMKVSQQTIASWEVGRTEPSNLALKDIADYFDVTTDYLLGRESTVVSLSKKQTNLLDMFEVLNDTGQSTLMNVLGALKMAYGKQERKAGITQRNSGGTNFLATGGINSYKIVQ